MKVRWLQVVLLLALLCVVVAKIGLYAHAKVANITPTAEQKESMPLKLKVVLLNQQYCVGDSELDSLKMKVRLTFTNAGSQRIILYKGSDLVSRVTISRKDADAAAKQVEVNASVTQVVNVESRVFKGSTPNSAFVVLLPNASYEMETIITIFAVRNDDNQIAGAVTSGEHDLQIQVSTWPDSKAVAEELRSRWQRSGCLWYDPITSAPVLFEVERQRKVLDCQ
jgi:methionine-rich copper-binding protein CopC